MPTVKKVAEESLATTPSAVAAATKGVQAEVVVAPPFTVLAAIAHDLEGSHVGVAGQNLYPKDSGAFTGDLSAPMLADSGASAVILGHSERRSLYGERDVDVRAKAEAAHKAGLAAIVCVGETAGERRLGLTLAVIARQLRGSLPKEATAGNTVIAYEPVWAIGTGRTPTPGDIVEVHTHIRGYLQMRYGAQFAESIRILYGGSMKPGNAAELLAIDGVDGGLIGGASLRASDFLAIAETCP